ncbi:MAG: DUF2232 domain-containing protein [Gemmatimonadota bacterium]
MKGAERGAWGRAGALALVVGAFSMTDPVALLLLCAAVVGLGFGDRDPRVWAAAGAAITAALWLTAGSPLVWLHRGWPLALAGAFVLLRATQPRWPLTAHSLGAVAIAGGLAAAIFAVWPQGWTELDRQVAVDFRLRADVVLAAGLEARMSEELEAAVRRAFAWAAALFPAWLGVASMAALGLTEFFRERIAGLGATTLQPVREFRFNDQWVWVWIAGLALLVVPAGAVAHRVGANAVLLLGALYALRGLGVVFAWIGGVSLGIGWIVALAILFLTPVLWVALTGVLVLGVSDTWLDLRRRFQRRANL